MTSPRKHYRSGELAGKVWLACLSEKERLKCPVRMRAVMAPLEAELKRQEATAAKATLHAALLRKEIAQLAGER